MSIYFSEIFGISPEILEEYGAFDISLVNDLPLFIDPFLIFNSTNPDYRRLHAEIIKYVSFLRDKAEAGTLNKGLLEAWFTFREVKQTWLGYSLSGNQGHGLGMDFARSFSANIARIPKPLGDKRITHGNHIEKVCLVEEGVGRDNISDFATNLIKHYLLEYTQTFARDHLQPYQRRVVAIPKAKFNYHTETWETLRFELPYVDKNYAVLTPVDLLTKDEIWINKTDMIQEYTEIAASVPNDQLRAQLNNFFGHSLEAIQRRDEAKRRTRYSRQPSRRRRRRSYAPSEPTRNQIREAAVATVQHFPEFLDYYLRWKEDRGDIAEAQADERVRSSERLYIEEVRRLVRKLRNSTDFYGIAGDTLEEARARVMFLKDVIENKGGWRIFYPDGRQIRKESDVQILFRLTWMDTLSDVSREVNDGRGPADFKISRGRFDKSIVEFKLASNTSLARNLQNQAEIYKKASDAQHGLNVIVYFTNAERLHVEAILKALKLDKDKRIILIDARDDNKPSASKADSVELQ
jgi:hypothetical protein